MNKITFQDFEKVEICAGTIVKAEVFSEARKPAYKLWIDFGSRGTLRSSAQITHYYEPDDLHGKQVVAVVNFPPKQVANFISECLVLGVVEKEGTVVLLQPDRKVQNGERIW